MTYSNLVITGSLAVDTIFLYENQFEDSLLPDQLSNLSVSFNVKNIIKNIGGTLLNIAYSASNFCPDKIKLIGAVGKDGIEIIDFLETNRLDTSNVLIDQNIPTACGTCITDKNNNQIWTFYYGACESVKDIDINNICNKDTLVIISPNHQDSFISLVKQCKATKIDFVLDVGMLIPILSKDELQYMISKCKYLIVNEYEMEQIKSKINFDEDQFINNHQILIVTLGSKGVKYTDISFKYLIPAYSGNCIDPVGAGDAWRGAFFGELINGKQIEDCLITANAIASIAVESPGGVNYKLDNQEIQNRFDIIKNSIK
jgi:adenosine kinase